ncbi:tetratricopeptide repeat protein [Eubacterium oxidoreducens]|uniref:Tetratricopeptide repeat-containing protein n=1 Tax=Eubacterium oxidoreducens TaxID=1732 RepID=A0A1G6BD48_EUBOX|nr:tetratricopeptide repeat protein [Eubacterium oxidoreducens]SDB18479.1 Tetratricopeptide repeat-containing protein [Eubacterium oxidoreducens]
MKRRIVVMMLLGAMGMLILNGCTSKEELENEQAYRTIGINDLKSGEYEDAIEAFDKALEVKSGGSVTNLEIDINYYKALAQYKNGDSDGAIETYTAIISYDEEAADAYYLRGNVYLQEEESKKAIADFEKAIELAEDFGEMSNQVGTALIGADMEDEAATYLNEVISKGGSSGEELYNVGNAYYLLEEYDQAISTLEEAKSSNDDATLLLAEVYLAKGETGNATAQIEEYTSSHSEDGEALNLAGCVAMQNEDYETAISCFSKGLEIEDVENEQELLQNEIAAYEYAGDFDTAYSLMQDYLEKYPEDEDAVRENTFLQTRVSGSEDS